MVGDAAEIALCVKTVRPCPCTANKQVLLQGKSKLITPIYESVNAYIDYLKLLFNPEVVVRN